MRTVLWCAVALAALGLSSISIGVAGPGDPRPVSLELTFPAGKSPRVFTKGWVFGARCVVSPGTAEEQDLSAEVAWSGSATFAPAKGNVSRPAFKAAGANTITLTVKVDGKAFFATWPVVAVDPTAEPRYARVSDIARCPSDAHGCEACPHPVEGPILTGSPNVTIEGLPAARKGDTGIHAACCGANTFEIAEGDPTVLIDGRPAARWGHETKHCGGSGKIDGSGKVYYAVFALTHPAVKKGRKPKLKDDATFAEVKAAYARLRVSDFDFKPAKATDKPLIVRLEGMALAEHPKMETGAAYALGVKGTLKHEKQRIPLSGTVLLTVRATYEDAEALAKGEKGIDAKQLAKVVVLGGADGTGTIAEEGQEFTVGPLTEGWSPASKEGAVNLLKQIMPYFDCFIAHAVYPDPDGDEVNSFRRFRETVLRRTPEGRRLIRLYEEYGPDYAMQVRGSRVLKPLARYLLDGIAAWVETLDLEDPDTLKDLDGLVKLADAAAAGIWEEGAGSGIGRLARIFAALGLR